MRPKTSLLWKYYTDMDNSYVKCDLCQKVLSRRGRTTSPLKSHLKCMHSEKYEEYCFLDSNSKNPPKIKRQQSSDGVSFSENSLDHARDDSIETVWTDSLQNEKNSSVLFKIDSSISRSPKIVESSAGHVLEISQVSPETLVWSKKLKSLDSQVRLYVEKAINDILFEAELGNIHKNSVKINV